MNETWLHDLRDELDRLEANDQQRMLRAIEPSITSQPIDNHDAQNDGHADRWLVRDGKRLLNFAGNDYLALSQHPKLKAAATEAIAKFGIGSGASRLVTGHLALHAQLEARYAAFKHAEAALLFSTGYMANLAVLTALPRRGDIICMDKLSHASLIDAARASAAALRIFPHLQTEKLERTLQRFETARSDTTADIEPAADARAFIVTDSVFSMDGDVADLPGLCAIAKRYNAVMIVDEAHATGILGANGTGLCELQQVREHVDVVVSTASKAMGGLGGIVSGAKVMIDTLINRARSLIYTTAPPPAQVAAIIAAIDVIEDEPDRRQRVLELAQSLRDRVASLVQPGVLELPATLIDTPATTPIATPILPLITGSAASALQLSKTLEKQGICAPAIRPPTVAPGSARVRITLRADMTDSDLDQLVQAIESWLAP